MARVIRAAYDQAAAAAAVKAVIPVGEVFNGAMQAGVADPNPYDGIDAGTVNLWTFDHYHASTHGYYLEALVIFGTLTGRDPRSLGDGECSAYGLGLSRAEVRALQQVAFDELAKAGAVAAAAPPPAAVGNRPSPPRRCAARSAKPQHGRRSRSTVGEAAARSAKPQHGRRSRSTFGRP